ncbi:hypothetical protein EON67_10435, partial [archaeon]
MCTTLPPSMCRYEAGFRRCSGQAASGATGVAVLSYHRFAENVLRPLPRIPRLLMSRLFEAFVGRSKQEQGGITLEDFIINVAVIVVGDVEMKADFLFACYDTEGFGELHAEELIKYTNIVLYDAPSTRAQYESMLRGMWDLAGVSYPDSLSREAWRRALVRM